MSWHFYLLEASPDQASLQGTARTQPRETITMSHRRSSRTGNAAFRITRILSSEGKKRWPLRTFKLARKRIFHMSWQICAASLASLQFGPGQYPPSSSTSNVRNL